MILRIAREKVGTLAVNPSDDERLMEPSLESHRKEIESLPDSADKRDLLANISQLEQGHALADRQEAESEAQNRKRDARLRLSGFVGVFVSVAATGFAVALAFALRPGDSPVSALLVGLVAAFVLYRSAFVLLKNYSSPNAFPTLRDWRARGLLDALRGGRQREAVSHPPVWSRSPADDALPEDKYGYRRVVELLAAEIVVSLPETCTSGTLAIDCDGISIICGLTNGRDGRSEPVTPALLSLSASCFVGMARSGATWRYAVVSCSRDNGGGWSFTTQFTRSKQDRYLRPSSSAR
jgi:hypothetical protein